MIVDAPNVQSLNRGPVAPGNLPDGTVVSSNSARCHRARTGDKSGRHSLSGRLPGVADRRVRAMNGPGFAHESVMLGEILDVFAGLEGGFFLDGTLGGAGHARAILAAHPNVRLLGLDQDQFALDSARRTLEDAGLGGRATLRRARFDSVSNVAAEEGIGSLAGALFDLGVSSPQFDTAERGFSYRFEGPLDMRMDRARAFSADDVVNGYDVESLTRVLRDNADERFAHRIATAIVASRPVRSTSHLAEIVVAAIPAPARRRGGHPAKRTFQAVRIEVNAELEIIAPTLRSTIGLLAPGARLAVITFHSGEDRIVKSVFRSAETGDCSCPTGLPCACGALRSVRRVRAPREASRAETAANPRSASARLRVVEKIAVGAGD